MSRFQFSTQSFAAVPPLVLAARGPSGRRHALASALGLALALMAGPSTAAPVAAHWTLTDLGTLGGERSGASAINASGQVTGYSLVAGQEYPHAFLYSDGVMTDLGGDNRSGSGINARGQVTGSFGRTAFLYSNGTSVDLGTLGGIDATGMAINAAGQVTGVSNISRSSDTAHAFLYRNGSMTDLGTLGGTFSEGRGINDAGVVTGRADLSGIGIYHAFTYRNGVMTDLGTLGGRDSSGLAINAAGQVTGFSNTDGNKESHAFLYTNGGLSDIGTLGGLTSIGHALNNAGVVTGSSATFDGATHAFIYGNGTMSDLNSLNGVAGSGWTLIQGNGINDAGQIVGEGVNPAGQSHAFIATLDTTVWESAFGGDWDASNGWSQGIGPNRNTDVYIDPTRSLTVAGPLGDVTVKTLHIGGGAMGNNGIATLHLNGGTITVLGLGQYPTTISPKGVLAGDGTITGTVRNLGTVDATNLTLTGRLSNAGLVTGNGRLNTSLTNTAAGTLRVDVGQTLRLSGAAHSNDGTVDINGGELQVASGVLANNAGGRILLNGGRLDVQSGLSNAGQVLVNASGATVFGAITTTAGGKIILSGNGTSTFYDGVDVQSGGELRVSAGSNVTFFGLVNQRTGAVFSGTGQKFYEGGLSVGASPGLGIDAGNVTFGAGSTYLAEIGGLTACTTACQTNEALKNSSFDKYIVQGHLGLGGTLKVTSWNGFTAQAGQRFDLLDWGNASGSFDSIDTSGLKLAAGTALDVSRLYVDGSISVQSVPEPETYALLLAGLAVVGVSARRRG